MQRLTSKTQTTDQTLITSVFWNWITFYHTECIAGVQKIHSSHLVGNWYQWENLYCSASVPILTRYPRLECGDGGLEEIITSIFPLTASTQHRGTKTTNPYRAGWERTPIMRIHSAQTFGSFSIELFLLQGNKTFTIWLNTILLLNYSGLESFVFLRRSIIVQV